MLTALLEKLLDNEALLVSILTCSAVAQVLLNLLRRVTVFYEQFFEHHGLALHLVSLDCHIALSVYALNDCFTLLFMCPTVKPLTETSR